MLNPPTVSCVNVPEAVSSRPSAAASLQRVPGSVAELSAPEIVRVDAICRLPPYHSPVPLAGGRSSRGTARSREPSARITQSNRAATCQRPLEHWSYDGGAYLSLNVRSIHKIQCPTRPTDVGEHQEPCVGRTIHGNRLAQSSTVAQAAPATCAGTSTTPLGRCTRNAAAPGVMRTGTNAGADGPGSVTTPRLLSVEGAGYSPLTDSPWALAYPPQRVPSFTAHPQMVEPELPALRETRLRARNRLHHRRHPPWNPRWCTVARRTTLRNNALHKALARGRCHGAKGLQRFDSRYLPIRGRGRGSVECRGWNGVSIRFGIRDRIRRP